ncbi:MAG: hypothetical protein U0165_14050 [Polyangiaceae bacterium]
MLCSMFIVVLVRAPASLEAAASSLVEIFELSLYEAKTHVQAPTPRVLAVRAERDDADDLATALRAVGFTIVVVDGRTIDPQHDADLTATLAFDANELVATRRDGERIHLAYTDIGLILRGMSASLLVSEVETTTRKLNVGKILLSGGLMTHDKVTTKTTQVARSHHGFLEVHSRDRHTRVIMFDQRMSFAFLGAKLQPAALANMTTVIQMIRERAILAKFDDRLLRSPNLGTLPLAPHGVDAESWKHEVAVRILAAAL